ncbi:DUF4091 domain-containing protein [Fulvivirgaceae bacterium BMA12]|uniref:DUF4091 domain-containing protein n=1 Tax=Agaribacillus aureus TaxID=3051825 RepID=A0ABT8L7B5_9BACT|nr:DUF4091 domain-containing protein [Fulvivirgaceae bacterium BMA12]
MKIILTTLLLVVSSGLLAQVKLWLVDPLEAIYPDTNLLSDYGDSWSAGFPQGTVVDVHIVLRLPVGEPFTFSAINDGKSLPLNCWSKLIDVPVEQNTGLDSRTEAFKGKVNPHVIRKAPFRVYEVIQPAGTNRMVGKNEFSAIRLAIPPSEFTKPGIHKIQIKIEGKDWSRQAIFRAEIHEVKIPNLSDSRFFYTNWFNLKRMEEKHAVERWTDAWFEMLKQYAEMMAHGRQNAITVPGELITLEDDRIVLDEARMLRFINVFRDAGFQYFESPHLMYRGDNDDWGDPELKVVLTKKRYYKEGGKEDVGTIVKLIKKFADKNGLSDRWLQHISDEPTEIQAECYKDIAAQVKSIYPDIRIMEATNDRDGIAGAIDLWCPLINDFQENEVFFREREKLGEKVLVYTCLIPGGKWLNRTLDMEKLRQVYFGWGAAHYNTFGYLHWGLNQYLANPFEQSVVPHPSPAASANNFLPAGDTHVIYPGKDGPLSSIRFEAHRIGIEDYEMLMKLKEQKPALSQKLIRKLFRSYTNYNTSLSDYRKMRKKLLRLL